MFIEEFKRCQFQAIRITSQMWWLLPFCSLSHKIQNGILVNCGKNPIHGTDKPNWNTVGGIQIKTKKKTKYVKGVITDVWKGSSQVSILKFKIRNWRNNECKKNSRETRWLHNNYPSSNISFDTENIPDHIVMHYQRYKVKPYIPTVPNGFKCKCIQHTLTTCRWKRRCVWCGQEHKFEECEKKKNQPESDAMATIRQCTVNATTTTTTVDHHLEDCSHLHTIVWCDTDHWKYLRKLCNILGVKYTATERYVITWWLSFYDVVVDTLQYWMFQ